MYLRKADIYHWTGSSPVTCSLVKPKSTAVCSYLEVWLLAWLHLYSLIIDFYWI